MTEKFLARHTTASLRALLDDRKPVVALVPIGSTEPHGPHLGLGTDVVISAAACVRATELFARKGPLTAVIAPAISYGVTECAQGFAGAVSVPAAVLTGRGPCVSVACPLTKKWAKTLDAEFKSGACHAGLYETSIMMAAAPEMVDDAVRGVLPPVPISLSQQLAAGVTTFAAMGMELAYAGDPASATVEEGERMIQRLAEMVVGEIREALGLPT